MQTPLPPSPPALDPNGVFHDVVPMVVLVVVLVASTAVVRAIFRSSVGEALAERIRQRSARRWGIATEAPQRVAALEQQVSQ